MKRFYIVLLVALIVFTSCEKHPIASFYSSEIDVYVNEDVFFTNTSMTHLPFWGRYREPKTKLNELSQ